MNYVKSLIVKFENQIPQNSIPLFRGAVIASMNDSNILFHNHKEDGFRYSYPLIQYKRINKKIAIVCFGEGTEVISDFFTQSELRLIIGDSSMDVIIEDVKAERTLINIWKKPLKYRINNWLPLNTKNYNVYKNIESLIEKTKLLEKILLGNILSAMKGFNITIQDQINCSITEISEPKAIKFKDVKLMSFNVEFNINISLPQYMGLGKHASIGYGILTKKTQ